LNLYILYAQSSAQSVFAYGVAIRLGVAIVGAVFICAVLGAIVSVSVKVNKLGSSID
jgi:hypothetical protein